MLDRGREIDDSERLFTEAFMRTAVIPAALFATLLAFPAHGREPKTVTTVEGITEYELDNGLRVLLFPDPSKPTTTVNITYLVGSRQESYGETGMMAHLLEHMLFKGSKKHTDIPSELTTHGARPNGSTSYDRTNYFETFAATAENLDWALDLSVPRSRNSTSRCEAQQRGTIDSVRAIQVAVSDAMCAQERLDHFDQPRRITGSEESDGSAIDAKSGGASGILHCDPLCLREMRRDFGESARGRGDLSRIARRGDPLEREPEAAPIGEPRGQLLQRFERGERVLCQERLQHDHGCRPNACRRSVATKTVPCATAGVEYLPPTSSIGALLCHSAVIVVPSIA